MGPDVVPVQSSGTMPTQTDVVVVGGGIVGVSAALSLARRGVRVVLCEKGHIGGEQSSRNWGWVRKVKRDPLEIPLMLESTRLWARLNEEIGDDTGYRAASIMFAARDDATVAEYEDWMDRARDFQVGARMLSRSEIDAVAPGMGQRWKSALYSPHEARAEPQMAAPAIAKAAQRAGAIVLGSCAVRGVELAGGKVAGVVTERGRIACHTVVAANGAWTSRFLRDLDLKLPQLKVRGSVMRTAPMNGPPDVQLWCGEASFRKRADGGYTIGSGYANIAPITPDSFRYFFDFLPALLLNWKALKLRIDERFVQEWREGRKVPLDQPSPYEAIRVLDPAPDRKTNETAIKDLAKLFPAFANARIVQHWAGLIDATPDVLPVISTVQSVPGLVIATGFSGHGFGIGPGAGALVADLVTGANPVVDPTPFRFSRFSDGSKVRPTGGI